MLKITISMYGTKREDLTEDRARIAFNLHMTSVGFRGLAHSTFDAWAEGYCTIRGVDSTVWINGNIKVAKRKPSDNTKKLVRIYMEELLDRYDDELKDLHIELEVEDDTDRYTTKLIMTRS